MTLEVEVGRVAEGAHGVKAFPTDRPGEAALTDPLHQERVSIVGQVGVQAEADQDPDIHQNLSVRRIKLLAKETKF